ncbi:hypothetical protein PG987_001173 [Apiospora arundinis]
MAPWSHGAECYDGRRNKLNRPLTRASRPADELRQGGLELATDPPVISVFRGSYRVKSTQD